MGRVLEAQGASVRAVAGYVPKGRLTNEELSLRYPEWSAEDILRKTGIRTRAVAAPDECASDLAFEAAKTLFEREDVEPGDVDLLIFCTQSPDYFLPTTACILQKRLGLSTQTMAFDLPLGCSGWVYGVSVARALLDAGEAASALLLTGDTYTRYVEPEDRNVAAIFGEAGAATLITKGDDSSGQGAIGPFVFGTDGAGAEALIVRGGASRNPQGRRRLEMDGPRIFEFCLRRIPGLVHALLEKAEIGLDDVDLWVFHQANRFMLDRLRKKTGIQEDRFAWRLEEEGNTVSSTIPLTLESAVLSGQLQAGMRVGVVGFGVGYSWGAGLIEWTHGGMQ